MAKIIIKPYEEPGVLSLLIERRYHRKGTNGTLYINGTFHSFCIELPWKDNEPNKSCIPEGVYRVVKRNSSRFGDHLMIDDVAGRDLILIHPANDALKELRGCIAPVSLLTGEGCGTESRRAFKPLIAATSAALDKDYSIQLTIFSKKEVVKGIKQFSALMQAVKAQGS